MRVYLVTAGDYSDTHVVGVFSTQEKADQVASIYPDGDACVRAVDVDADPGFPKGKQLYMVSMNRQGDTIATERSAPNGYPIDKRCWLGQSYQTPKQVVMRTKCWAGNEHHAVKIANERRSMLIALGKWPQNWDKQFCHTLNNESCE